MPDRGEPHVRSSHPRRRPRDPLRARYQTEPDAARITDRARTTGGAGADPFHVTVVPGSQEYGVQWPLGIHHAVGGDHDAGFQQMRCAIDLQAAPGTDPARLQRLLPSAEHCCVHLQTLRAGVPVHTTLRAGPTA